MPLRDQYTYHIWNSCFESVGVLNGLFDGRQDGGSWSDWITPEGSEIESVKRHHCLNHEIVRIQNSINGHLEFIENNPSLPLQYILQSSSAMLPNKRDQRPSAN